jgi:hypothetical protein
MCSQEWCCICAYALAQVAIVQCIHISLVPDIECKSVLVCFIVFAHVDGRYSGLCAGIKGPYQAGLTTDTSLVQTTSVVWLQFLGQIWVQVWVLRLLTWNWPWTWNQIQTRILAFWLELDPDPKPVLYKLWVFFFFF